MTDREKYMIEYYIPSPRDETLDDNEYYIKAEYSGRVHKVYISDICPDILHDRTLYGVRYSATGKRFYKDENYGTVQMSELYDNKQDCKEQTHLFYDAWERLRGIE